MRMNVRPIYPEVKKRRLTGDTLITTLRWPFALAAYICPIVNICIGGKAWSLIVLWSLFMVWTLVISPDLVEYNRISQFIKLAAYSCLLLLLINICLSPGWAVRTVSIVCFSAIAVVGVLFYSDARRQKQNMFPMLLLCAVCFVGAVLTLCFWRGWGVWAVAVMGAFALALPASCFIIYGGDIRRELKRRFHTR